MVDDGSLTAKNCDKEWGMTGEVVMRFIRAHKRTNSPSSRPFPNHWWLFDNWFSSKELLLNGMFPLKQVGTGTWRKKRGVPTELTHGKTKKPTILVPKGTRNHRVEYDL